MKKTIKRGLCVGVDNSFPESNGCLLLFLPLSHDESGYTMRACPESFFIPYEIASYRSLLSFVFSYVDIFTEDFSTVLSIKLASNQLYEAVALE